MNEATNVAKAVGPPARRVLVGALAPIRPRNSVRAKERERREADADCPPQQPEPQQIALLLALAYWIEWQVASGAVPCAATVARRLGLSRARITQIGDLALLGPRLQETILLASPGEVGGATGERILRRTNGRGCWKLQEEVLGWETPFPLRETHRCRDPFDRRTRRCDARPGQI